jgi:hypothetical protein
VEKLGAEQARPRVRGRWQSLLPVEKSSLEGKELVVRDVLQR